MRGKRAKQLRALASNWARAKNLFEHRKFKRFYRNVKKAYVRGELSAMKP